MGLTLMVHKGNGKLKINKIVCTAVFLSLCSLFVHAADKTVTIDVETGNGGEKCDLASKIIRTDHPEIKNQDLEIKSCDCKAIQGSSFGHACEVKYSYPQVKTETIDVLTDGSGEQCELASKQVRNDHPEIKNQDLDIKDCDCKPIQGSTYGYACAVKYSY